LGGRRRGCYRGDVFHHGGTEEKEKDFNLGLGVVTLNAINAASHSSPRTLIKAKFRGIIGSFKSG